MSEHEARAQVFGEYDPAVAQPSHLSSAQFETGMLPQTTQHAPAAPGFAQHEVSTPSHAAHFGVENDNRLAPYMTGTRSTSERATSMSSAGLYPISHGNFGSLWNLNRPKGE